jgi:hypothetical protein
MLHALSMTDLFFISLRADVDNTYLTTNKTLSDFAALHQVGVKHLLNGPRVHGHKVDAQLAAARDQRSCS